MSLSGRLTILRNDAALPAELYLAEDLLDFETALHFHSEVQLVFIFEGLRKFSLHRHELVLRAGDCLIIPPYLPHRGTSLAGVPSTFDTLYVAKDRAVQKINAKEFFNENSPAVVVHDKALLERFANKAEREKIEPDAIFKLMEIQNLRNACQISRSNMEFAETTREALIQARTLLAAETCAPPSLDSVARKIGISKFHFTRQFSRLYGMSPYAFNLRCRLNLSKSLLAKGDSVSSVANDLGFFDQSHFGLHFRRVMGLTPASYQKRLS